MTNRTAIALLLFSAPAVAQENFDAGGISIGSTGHPRFWDPLDNGDGILELNHFVSLASIGSGSHMDLYNGHHHYLQLNYADWFIPGNDGWWQLGWDALAWNKVTSYEYASKPVVVTCSGTSAPCVVTTVPASSSMRFNCADVAGCEYAPDAGCTLLDNGFQSCTSDGQQLCVTNVSTNPLLVRDAPGFMELQGGFYGGQNANLCLEYQAPGHWVEKSRSFP